MGGALPRCHAGFDHEVKVVVAGPDAPGRATFIRELTRGVHTTTAETIGFAVTAWEDDDVRYAVWDVGFQKKSRRLCHHYSGAQAVIFAVDCSDRSLIKEAREELVALAADGTLKGAALLVVSRNDASAVRAIRMDELSSELRLDRLRGCSWLVLSAQALAEESARAGVGWLSGAVASCKQSRSPMRRGASLLSGSHPVAQDRATLGCVGGD